MLHQVTAATIRQLRADATDLSFAAPGENITSFKQIYQESHLIRPVKTNHGPAPRQQDPQIGNLENKAASWQD